MNEGKYAELLRKAEACKINAMNAKSTWARGFWWEMGEKLVEQAMSMTVGEAAKSSIIAETFARR